MRCKNCGEDMILTNKWGDGYYEPREEKYECPNCEAICLTNQAYGEEWRGLIEEEEEE